MNELVARLTHSPVNDSTQTNRTLTSSPATFPLNRPMYADFSHDRLMLAVYAALGLFEDEKALPANVEVKKRKWRSREMVPFSAVLVTERVECGSGASISTTASWNGGKAEGKVQAYVRMFVDDALMDLDFCGAGSAGMCTVEAFVESQAYARNQGMGDFEKCFENEDFAG